MQLKSVQNYEIKNEKTKILFQLFHFTTENPNFAKTLSKNFLSYHCKTSQR